MRTSPSPGISEKPRSAVSRLNVARSCLLWVVLFCLCSQIEIVKLVFMSTHIKHFFFSQTRQVMFSYKVKVHYIAFNELFYSSITCIDNFFQFLCARVDDACTIVYILTRNVIPTLVIFYSSKQT